MQSKNENLRYSDAHNFTLDILTPLQVVTGHLDGLQRTDY